MKSVPTSTPMAIAIRDQIRFPPVVMPMSPTAGVAICALLMNHRGPMLETFPWRSSNGT